MPPPVRTSSAQCDHLDLLLRDRLFDKRGYRKTACSRRGRGWQAAGCMGDPDFRAPYFFQTDFYLFWEFWKRSTRDLESHRLLKLRNPVEGEHDSGLKANSLCDPSEQRSASRWNHRAPSPESPLTSTMMISRRCSCRPRRKWSGDHAAFAAWTFGPRRLIPVV